MVITIKRLVDGVSVAILEGKDLSFLEKATSNDRISLDTLFHNSYLTLQGHTTTDKSNRRVSVTEVIEVLPRQEEFIPVILGDLPIHGYEFEKTESE